MNKDKVKDLYDVVDQYTAAGVDFSSDPDIAAEVAKIEAAETFEELLPKTDPRLEDFLWLLTQPIATVICAACGGRGRLVTYVEMFPRRRWMSGGWPCPCCYGRGAV